MRRVLIAYYLLLLSLHHYVDAIPKFHTVNSHFHNGTTCPAVTRPNVLCPVLCVTNQALCPPQFGPQSCPNGSSLCIDGSCRAVLKACRSSAFHVDIPNYDPKNMTLQQYEACSTGMNIPSTIQNTWANLPSNQQAMIWNICEAPQGMNFPIRAVIVIVYLAVHLAFFPLWGLWAIYKHAKEKKLNMIHMDHANGIKINGRPQLVELETSPSSSNEIIHCEEKDNSEKGFAEHVDMEGSAIEEEKQEDHNELTQRGFKRNTIGNSMIVYMGVISIFWIGILLLLCLDYYGYVIKDTPFGLFYNSYDLSSKAFCVAWFLSTSWYLFINIARTKIKNYFRIETTFANADFIQIRKPRRVIQMKSESERSVIMPALSKFESMTRQLLGFDTLTTTVPVVKLDDQQRYFEFQSTRYHYEATTQTFEPVDIKKFFSMKPQDLVTMKKGLDDATTQTRLQSLGPNFIEVKVPSFLQALWEELTGFFYIYQLQILWCYFYLAYWQIGISDTGVILLAALIKVIVRLKSEKRVKTMAEHVDTCQVLRNQVWSGVSTADLVPGDVVKVEAGQTVPVDAVILCGDIVVDESSLTGEPLPIRKFPLRSTDDSASLIDFDCQSSAGKTNSLFAGTTVKQSTADAIALVLKTRTDTDKGQLVQRILFPQPVSFIFNEQLKLVFFLLLLWALVLLGFGAWWLGGTGMTAWFYGTICAAQVMNPLLPAILVVGQSVAAGRLKKKGVFCVDFPRILMAGKVQVFCFDKTGTLTKEGLEYYGVYPAKKEAFEDLQPSFTELSNTNNDLMQMGLSCCHSVTMLNGDYVGNPVDLVMFQATEASLSTDEAGQELIIPNKNQGPTLKVLQLFEFQHARATMSIAVKDMITGHVHVFCKGSFERIADVSASGIPANFDEITSHSARVGCYVLGMAHRDLGILSQEEEDQLATHCTRDQLESDLTFIGLVLFKNLLKEDTADAIQQIKQGDVRVVMITGDNALTGVFIGQQCHFVPPNAQVIVGDVMADIDKLVWTDADTGKPVEHIDAAIASGYELAMTGKAFRLLVSNGTMRDYLFSTRIFARMTPVDKMQCVELLMERAITAMCGDGGNDCGALRSAHVGIAMSEAEASVVSPFSTPNRSVQACVDLLIQGRSALATSFASYKYLIMYGETMATVKFCTFYYTMSFSQWNFILIDAFITVFCAFAVTQAGAAKRLSHHRPTARILGPEVLLSVLGQLWINVWFLIGAFIWLYTRDDFFRCREWDARATDASKWWLLGDSFEADVLTFIALFQFVNCAMVFNYGYIFRQRWYRNYFLIVVWAVFISIVSYWELADPNRFGCLMRLNCGNPDVLVSLGYERPSFYIEPYNNPLGHNVLPKSFRYQFWAYSIVNMLVVHVWERFVILGPVRHMLRNSNYNFVKRLFPFKT
ncbi:AdoMet-homocysteine methyltransferase [Mucor velutinosus]|uniref:AdoMet-homocysteine methyltransferase n=1 Tax=Mucor velutinosus TaxID=708070 RepID=A0AAN7I086_9FUNG|nr:AdoMet-homocysteine methyltransferase [Mucor velutinosus]